MIIIFADFCHVRTRFILKLVRWMDKWLNVLLLLYIIYVELFASVVVG